MKNMEKSLLNPIQINFDPFSPCCKTFSLHNSQIVLLCDDIWQTFSRVYLSFSTNGKTSIILLFVSNINKDHKLLILSDIVSDYRIVYSLDI